MTDSGQPDPHTMTILPVDQVTDRRALATVDPTLADEMRNVFLDLLLSYRSVPGMSRVMLADALTIDVADTRDGSRILVIDAGALDNARIHWSPWSGNRVEALVFAEDAAAAVGIEILIRHGREDADT